MKISVQCSRGRNVSGLKSSDALQIRSGRMGIIKKGESGENIG